MAGLARPRRSALFVPGSNARAMAKARTLDADIVIFDLEDAVAPAQKPAARAAIAAALAEGGYRPRELALRVNGVGTAWVRDDLALAATLAVDAVLLPKVDAADQVRQAAALLEAGGAPAETRLWCMLESALGILRAAAIAGADPRVGALVAGTADLAKDLHALPGRDRVPLVPALAQVVLAARAHGLAAIDGIEADLEDEAGFEAACNQGRALGFDGKSLIHPKQIAPANRVFAPAPDELAAARRLIEAHAAAEAAGSGVVLVDGRLVERLHVEEAQRLLALAAAIAARATSAPAI